MKHKLVGTELTQAEYEEAKNHLGEGGNTILDGVVAVDPPSIVAGGVDTATAAIANLLTTHRIIVMCQDAAFENGLVPIAAYCAVDGTLSIRISNWTAGAIDGASRNWAYIAF